MWQDYWKGHEYLLELLSTTMDYKEEYAKEKREWIDKQVEDYEERTGIVLDAHNKATFRRLKAQEFGFWEHWEARQDNNRYHDDV